MTIGPEPTTRTERFPSRVIARSASSPDPREEFREETVRIARAGRCLRVELHGLDRQAFVAQAFVDAVVEVDERLRDAGRQRRCIDGVAVIVRGDEHLAAVAPLDRLVTAAVPVLHLICLSAKCEREELVTEADAEYRKLLVVDRALERF